MTMRALFTASALLAASFTPSLAETVTNNVSHWDQANRTITLEDKTQFVGIPATITVPGDLQVGDEVTIDYQASEDGVLAINEITVTRDIAKRLLPNNKRG
jgi:hypothetical protein